MNREADNLGSQNHSEYLKVLVIFEGSLGKVKSTRGENDRMFISIWGGIQSRSVSLS